MKYLLWFAVLLPGIASCNCHEEPCQPGGLVLEVVGFDSSELKGYVMHRYDTQGFYPNLLETIPGRGIIVDTINGVPHTILTTGPLGGYNWDVEFPTISKTVRIYNLRYERQSQKRCSWFGDKYEICTSPIRSYTMDSVVYQINTSQQTTYFNYVSIHR